MNNPNDRKYRDLNFSKIRLKLDKCRPAFYLLLTAGFNQSVDETRLQWQKTSTTWKLLQEANTGLQAKMSGQDGMDNSQYGSVIDPTQTSIIKDWKMNIDRKQKEKQKLEKLQKQAQEQELQKGDFQKVDKWKDWTSNKYRGWRYK